MANLRNLLEKLPVDDDLLRRIPVPGLTGACILEIDTSRGLLEAAATSPLDAVATRTTPSLDAILDGLHHGARDDKVKGLIAHAGTGLTLAQADELRGAVARFRDSGKPCVVWSESYGEFGAGQLSAYLFASAFDEIWLQPSGDVSLLGAGFTQLFLRGALDKLGITPQFRGRKEYKSAASQLTEHEFTEADREQMQAIADSITGAFAAEVSAARGLSPEAVRALVDGPILPAPQALEAGLVDKIGYRDEAYASIRARIGDSPAHPAQLRYVDRYSGKGPLRPGQAVTGMSRLGRKRPVIALVHAQGPIHTGRGGQGPFSGHTIGSESLGAALRHAVTAKAAAVVLRVNSPGGSAAASDAIRREVHQVREAGIPVIASMGAVAASGGYYISMGASEIVAGAHTITGSIGVLAGKLVTGAALGRIGITHDSVENGRFSRMLSAAEPFSDAEWEMLDALLDRIYDDFVSKAAADRAMSVEQLEPLAHGRVWTGRDARERGLIDHVGGLSAAIERACVLLGVLRDDAEVQVMPKLSVFDRFLPSDNSDAPAAAAFSAGPGIVDRALAAAGLGSYGVLSVPGLAIPR